MKRFLSKLACKTRAYNHKREFVQDNLALTPSQMNIMAKSGTPISTQVLGADHFDDGVEGSLSDVPLEYQRGIDVSDIYDYQQRSRAAVRAAAKNNINPSE